MVSRLSGGRKSRIGPCGVVSRSLTYNQMIVDTLSDSDVDRMFRALADSTRRDIVRRTLVAEVSVSTLASSYAMSFAAVQKHVAVLEEAQLVSKTPRGRERMVRGNADRIRQAQGLLDEFERIWRSRIDRLDALLEAQPGSSDSTSSTTNNPDR